MSLHVCTTFSSLIFLLMYIVVFQSISHYEKGNNEHDFETRSLQYTLEKRQQLQQMVTN